MAVKKTKQAVAVSITEEAVRFGPEEKLLLALPPIGDALRDAFRAQKSEAACEALGKNTSSAGVYREAGQFGATMYATLSTHGVKNVRYGLGALVWYLECVRALGVENRRQSLGAMKSTTSSAAGQLSVEVVRVQRTRLHERIESVIEGDAMLEAGFAAVRGDTKTEAALISSLEQSADFAEEVLNAKPLLAAEFGLTADDVASARTAATNAKTQRTARSLDGAVQTKDDAATNRIEGRVLFEMRRAMRFFNAAAKQGYGTRLVPGPATRHVLAPERKKKPADLARKKKPEPA